MYTFDEFWVTDVDKDVDCAAMEIQSSLAKTIERLMFKNNITEIELADMIRHTNSYVERLLQGDARVDVRTLVQLSIALNCNLIVNLIPKE